jgi:NADPH2:quinone reductase
MKALAYENAHALDAFAMDLLDVAEPRLRDRDLLIEIHAVGVNPGEAHMRATRSAEPGGRLVLGWEFAGVVVGSGSAVTGFTPGDRVMGTGDVSRDGCWAERLAVDHRVVAKIPPELSFVDAASLPIGGITAWEALFRHEQTLPPGVDRVLVIGGAGGVGSMATQLLKARTSVLVVATASRAPSQDWCRAMGADLVVDHTEDVATQLAAAGLDHVDMVLSTAGTADNIGRTADLLRPFGHLAATDWEGPLDISPLVMKSASLHSEMVFSQIVSGADPSNQARILESIIGHVVAGRVRPIVTTQLDGLSARSMKTAHELLETRRTVGKIVITT